MVSTDVRPLLASLLRRWWEEGISHYCLPRYRVGGSKYLFCLGRHPGRSGAMATSREMLSRETPLLKTPTSGMSRGPVGRIWEMWHIVCRGQEDLSTRICTRETRHKAGISGRDSGVAAGRLGSYHRSTPESRPLA